MSAPACPLETIFSIIISKSCKVGWDKCRVFPENMPTEDQIRIGVVQCGDPEIRIHREYLFEERSGPRTRLSSPLDRPMSIPGSCRFGQEFRPISSASRRSILVPKKRFALWIIAISIPVVLHAVYNTFGWSLIGLGAGLLSVILLMTYLSNCNQMHQNLGET